jgi:hypothetical protein
MAEGSTGSASSAEDLEDEFLARNLGSSPLGTLLDSTETAASAAGHRYRWKNKKNFVQNFVSVSAVDPDP